MYFCQLFILVTFLCASWMIEAIPVGSHPSNAQQPLSPVENVVPCSLEGSHASSSRRSHSLSHIRARQRRLRNSFEFETISRHSISAPATPSNGAHSMQIGNTTPNFKHNTRIDYHSEPDEHTKQLLDHPLSPFTSSVGNPNPSFNILYSFSSSSSLQLSSSPNIQIPQRTHSLSPQRYFDTTRRGRLGTSL